MDFRLSGFVSPRTAINIWSNFLFTHFVSFHGALLWNISVIITFAVGRMFAPAANIGALSHTEPQYPSVETFLILNLAPIFWPSRCINRHCSTAPGAKSEQTTGTTVDPIPDFSQWYLALSGSS